MTKQNSSKIIKNALLSKMGSIIGALLIGIILYVWINNQHSFMNSVYNDKFTSVK